MITMHLECVKIFSSCDKINRRIMDARKKPCRAGLRPQEQFDWKKLSGGRTAISPLKLDTRAAALSLLAGALLKL